MQTGNRYLNDLENMDLWTPLSRLFSFCFGVFREIYRGLRFGYFPIIPVSLVTLVLTLALHWHWDFLLFARLGIKSLYPRHHLLFPIYKVGFLTMGVWLWGIAQVVSRRRRQKYLDSVFDSCGLRNAQGKYPQLIVDVPFDGNIRKMRVTREYLPHDAFVKAKAALEGAMGVYVRDFKEQRQQGTEEIFYSAQPESYLFEVNERDIHARNAGGFLIGERNGVAHFGSLKNTSHLLIAGETGSGKSTFLKQLITQLYINHGEKELTLIDLKGGLEFQFFKNLPAVSIVGNLEDAVTTLVDFPQYLTFNPVLKKLRPVVPIVEARHLNLSQIKALLTHVDNRKYGLAIWIQIYLGLRAGELVALRWEDVDLEVGRIHIRRTAVKKTGVFRDYPKGGKQHSHSIPSELLERLVEAKRNAINEFVVASPKGGCLPYRWYLVALKKYCREANVPVIASHGLRHSTSELYIHHGATRDDLRRLFAHSTPAVTDRYVHNRGTNLERVANVIQLFPAATGTK